MWYDSASLGRFRESIEAISSSMVQAIGVGVAEVRVCPVGPGFKGRVDKGSVLVRPKMLNKGHHKGCYECQSVARVPYEWV